MQIHIENGSGFESRVPDAPYVLKSFIHPLSYAYLTRIWW